MYNVPDEVIKEKNMLYTKEIVRQRLTETIYNALRNVAGCNNPHDSSFTTYPFIERDAKDLANLIVLSIMKIIKEEK